jgi:cytosine/adenosine deaminase-related metal-dependent hydrolase
MSNRILITGGHIVPAPPADADLERGDLLVVDGKIAEIAPSISVEADEVIDASGQVVIPGLIDTHRHMWETTLRNFLPEGDLMDYLFKVLSQGVNFRPQDVFTSNLLGAAGALDAGITTVLDWSHISNTPEHSDAAISALQASGIRAVYAHSVGLDPLQDWLGPESVKRHPEDLRRIVDQYAGSDDSLLTLAAAVRGPEFSDYDAAWDDIRFARELALPISMHVGCAGLGARATVEHMRDQGLLGPDVTYIHANTCSDEAIQLIADSGGTISSSPAVEAGMGHGAPSFARFAAAGLKPSLSIDAEVGVAGDLFGAMRSAYEQARMVAHTIVRDGGTADLPTTRDVLGWATMEGARTLGLDHRIGSLEVGKQADIAILDLNGLHEGPVNSPVGAVVLNASPTTVTHVLVAGNVVKRDGKLTGLDVDQLVADGKASQERLAQQASAATA